MRVIGLDYGARTVGVAVSDGTGLIATARETIFREHENQLRETLRRIEALAGEEHAECIVLGLPLHMDGSMSERAEKTAAFGKKLETRIGLPVILQDERLTSREAQERLRGMVVPSSEWKEREDAIAAEIILQDYLDEQKRKTDV